MSGAESTSLVRRRILRDMKRKKADEWDRAADLAAIHVAYDGYAFTGRHRLWNEQQRGYGRLARQLRKQVVLVLRESVLSAGTRVLDLGCGSGRLFDSAREELPERFEWTGVDLREDAIAEARKAFRGATFMVSSADAVPLPDASFDVVVAQLLFSSLPSLQLEEAVAAEITRLLKPDGLLVWLDIRYSNPTNRAVHGMPMGRIGHIFPQWRTELCTTGLLPPIARRLGVLAKIAYPMLSAMSPLRSHIVGRLTRPTILESVR